jgi:adenylosuccinate lyase
MRESAAYAHLWGTDELRAAFEDGARVQSWLDILTALALAQAELGLIPQAAAEEIGDRARIESLDLDYVVSETRATSHSLLGLIRGAQKVLSPEAGEWFCYGATVQDVSDTWMVLALRTMGGIAYRDLRAIEEALLRLAREHRTTPVAARTHGQPGLPIPFGFKLAVWASEVRRHLERLKEGRDRWLVGQLGGAVGTASIWGEQAGALQERFCSRLGLAVPDVSWVTARDRFAEFANLLAMVAHTLAKIGNEIVQLQRPELGEAAEPFLAGQVGSITMPHKRNPERAEHLVTLARLIRADAGVLLESMIVEHERDGRAWKAEWAAFPDICLLTGVSLTMGRSLTEGLVTDPDRMLRNLIEQRGYVLSERVMRELAGRIGKQSAHQAVYAAAMAGQERGQPFRDALEATPEVAGRLSPAELDRLLDLGEAMGLGPQLVDRVLERAERIRSAEAASWT